jgi:hypothetical protein
MRPFRFRPDLAALALAAVAIAGMPGRATATSAATICEPANEVKSALNSSLALLRRVLHLDDQQEVVSHAISLGNREATLELEIAGAHSRTLSLRGGRIYIDGEPAGTYTPGGALDRSWRRILAEGASLDTRGLLVSLRSWRGPTLTGDEVAAKARLDTALRGLEVKNIPVSANAAVTERTKALAEAEVAASQGNAVRLNDLASLDTIGRQLSALGNEDVAEALRSAPVHLGGFTVPRGQTHDGDLVVYRGGANVFGEVTGHVVSLFGDVTAHPGSKIGKNAVSVGGAINALGDASIIGERRIISPDDLHYDIEATIEADEAGYAEPQSALDRTFNDTRNVVAIFIAFAMLGFGTVFFGRRYIEVVADTASHSFGRSFVVGLLGQLLLLPTFAMLIVGLIFTLVGILLLPFAAVAFVIAAILAAVGGYLAVAHAIGETVTRRRMAHGAFVRAPNAYGYLFAGLIGLLGLWAAAALTGWMGPVVIVFRVAAVIVTWIAVTTGFGAVLLSRAGLRETFAGRHVGEMSDEYLWATPPATPTAARMRMDK